MVSGFSRGTAIGVEKYISSPHRFASLSNGIFLGRSFYGFGFLLIISTTISPILSGNDIIILVIVRPSRLGLEYINLLAEVYARL